MMMNQILPNTNEFLPKKVERGLDTQQTIRTTICLVALEFDIFTIFNIFTTAVL